jgi:hypothetical protein
MKKLAVPVLLSLFALAAAQAQNAPTAAGSAQSGAGSPGFRCGGVGNEDQQRMKAEAGQHDLMLTFATASGAYQADVDVEITSGGKVVLQGRCNGPLMLADLGGKGTYQVKAVSNGRELRKSVTLAGKPTRVTFTWPS